MGKSAPKAPDPKETASAQTSTNIGTSIANSYLGNINQVTPDGSLTYSQTGTNKWTDPNSGKVYELPTWTATQSLSQNQQLIKDQNDAASRNLATLANTQSGKLNNLLGSPLDMSKIPAGADASKLGLPNYQQFTSGPQLQTQIGSQGNIQNAIAGGGNIQTGLGDQGKAQTTLGNAGNITGSIANAGNIQRGPVDSGKIQTSLGDAGDITRSYNTDFSADRQKVEEALLARMNPQLANDRAALEQSLVNRGLQPGSEAYNRAVDEANRTATDARYGAILNAGQEQSRLVGLEEQRAAFQNSAQQQAYGQQLNSGQFANAAQAQQYQQNANNMQMGNAAQAQQYGQNANNATFANAAQNQRFGQNLSAGQFANSGQQQNFNNALQAGQFGNQAQNQQFAQNQAQLQANNSAQQQAYQQAMQNAQFTNSTMQQMHQNQNTATGANNSLQDQSLNAQITRNNAINQQRQQALQEAYAQRNQPINEITALMSGGQVSNPSFMNIQGQTMPTVDYAGLVQQDYANRMGAYNQSQANGGALLGGLASLFSLSDKDAKKDIQKVGGLYSYRYKGEGKNAPKRIGVMAQEVEKVRPDTVRKGADGLRRVNYGALFGAGAN